MSEAHTGEICPADNEECLKVSRGLEIRWTGPRNEARATWARPLFLPAPEVGLGMGGYPTEHLHVLPSPIS